MKKRLFFTLFIFLSFGAIAIAQEQKDKENQKKRKVSFTGLPFVSYNSSYGFIGGVRGMAFFNTKKNDTISPPSMAGIMGAYTENKSWFGSAFTQLYLNEDRWRVTFAAGLGHINFQYFESGGDLDEGSFVDYSNVTRFYYLKGLRQIIPHLYGGALVKLQHSEVEFDVPEDSISKNDANGVGISALYDTRDYIYYPTKGWQVGVNFLTNPKWMGSDEVYNSIRAYANYYYKINDKMILANRASIFSGLGSVPFTAQHAIGGKDIRGYTDGKYRGEQAYALQTEYRYTFYRRWGMVGFLGAAFTEKPYSGILPGGGAGVRFKAITSRNINIGIDYAVGKGDNGIYFRINEAF